MREKRLYLGGCEVYRKSLISTGVVQDERETVHLSDDHRRVCMAETKTVTNENPVGSPTTYLRFQLDNHLGTCAVEVEADGAVVSYEEYHPYGTSAYRAQRGTLDVSAKRYRYTGKERDEETGLYYHGARYYAPWLGRWTAADPLAFAGGAGPYGYVSNRPVVMNDPNGRTEFNMVEDARQHDFSAAEPSGAKEPTAKDYAEMLTGRQAIPGQTQSTVPENFSRSVEPAVQDTFDSSKGREVGLGIWAGTVGVPEDWDERVPVPNGGYIHPRTFEDAFVAYGQRAQNFSLSVSVAAVSIAVPKLGALLAYGLLTQAEGEHDPRFTLGVLGVVGSGARTPETPAPAKKGPNPKYRPWPLQKTDDKDRRPQELRARATRGAGGTVEGARPL